MTKNANQYLLTWYFPYYNMQSSIYQTVDECHAALEEIIKNDTSGEFLMEWTISRIINDGIKIIDEKRHQEYLARKICLTEA